MATVHPASIAEIAARLDGPRAAVVSTRLAEIMGVFQRPDGARIDRAMVGNVINAAAKAGLAEEVAARADSVQPSDTTIVALLRALEYSPRPSDEINYLSGVVGFEQLSALVGASESSLRRYTAETRDVPDSIAARIHFVAILVAILRGSFNEFGIRRWFHRPHPDLAEHSPAQFLTGNWDPSDDRPQSTAEFATRLLW
jgi:hypothetical protein